MKTVKHKCSCTSELHREAWVTLCPEHEAEFRATHERWAAEHRAASGGSIQPTKSKKESVSLATEAPLTLGQLTSTDTTIETGKCSLCGQKFDQPEDMGSANMGNNMCMDCYNHEGV